MMNKTIIVLNKSQIMVLILSCNTAWRRRDDITLQLRLRAET